MPQNDNPKALEQSLQSSLEAAGPLVVSEANPRYFTVASEEAAGARAVYLTGSHIWNNFHDGMGPGWSGLRQHLRAT